MEHTRSVQYMLFVYQFLVRHSLCGFLSNLSIPSIHHILTVALEVKLNIFHSYRSCMGDPCPSAAFSNYILLILLPHWISLFSANIAHLPQPRGLSLSTPPYSASLLATYPSEFASKVIPFGKISLTSSC